MDVQTITESPKSAKIKLTAYRAQLHRRADAEYESIAKGYEAMAKGLPLIDLGAVMRGAKCDGQGRPRLAIARADRKQVEFARMGWNGDRGVFDTRLTGVASSSLCIDVELRPLSEHQPRFGRGYALVPLVPADLIESIGGRVGLRSHFVLWEVEEWADRRIMVQPDRDPLLLRRLGGDLFAVRGSWELTELERAVMAGRRTG